MLKSIRNLVKPLNIKCWFNTLFFVFFINTNLFLKLITNNSFINDLINVNIELQRSRYSLFERINYIREDIKSIDLLNYLFEQDEPKLKTELKLPENRNCSNLPFFELFIINFLNRLGLNVMDMFYMDISSVYLYYSIYYTYSILPDISYVTANLFSATNNKHRLNKIEEYFLQDELKKLDVLVVSHYDYNHQLTTYFNALKVVLDTLPEPPIGIKVNNINENITELKFNNTNGNNYINIRFYLFACLLRNYNADKQQKTILAFISNINGNQYIIHDLRKKNIKQKFNWLSSNKFTNEELEITKKGFTYKYNFSKGEKLLLYVNITDKDELLKEENDKRIEFCREIDVIPQFGGTCWFNAILMAILYSQGSRSILFKEAKDCVTEDSLLMVLKTILYSSHSSDTVKRNNLKTLFTKLKPEAIMLKTLDVNKYAKDDVKTVDFNKYAKDYLKKNIKKNLKKIFSFGFSIIFILSFLKRLNLTFI